MRMCSTYVDVEWLCSRPYMLYLIYESVLRILNCYTIVQIYNHIIHYFTLLSDTYALL